MGNGEEARREEYHSFNCLRGRGAGEEGDEARDPQKGAKTLNKRIKLKTPLAIVLLL